MLTRDVCEVGGSVRIERRLLRGSAVRAESDGGGNASFHLLCRSMRERLRNVHDHRGLLPRYGVLRAGRQHARHLRPLREPGIEWRRERDGQRRSER
jgi:hypothetical protein